MPKLSFYFLISLLVSGIIFSSCNEQPTELGTSLLTDTVEVYGISSDDNDLLLSSGTKHSDPQTFGIDEILFGKSGETEAISFVRFILPDSLDALLPEDMISAKLKVYPSDYAFGNLENPYQSFSIKQVNKFWFKSMSSPDSNTTYDMINTDASYFGNQIATWSGVFPIADSGKTAEPIIFDFPKELLEDWLTLERVIKDNVKDPTKKDTTYQPKVNWGLAFLPNDDSEVISQINAQNVPGSKDEEEYTHIELIYNHSSGTIDTLKLHTGIEATFSNSPDGTTDDKIVIQGSVEKQGLISFDVSEIPALAGIHKAEMTLISDTGASRWGNKGRDSIFRAIAYDINEKSTSTAFTGRFVDGSDKILKFPSIAQAVQIWVRKGGKGSLEIAPASINDQMRQIDRTEFFGVENENPALRPKITIIYSLQPRDK